jgi:hypothetical protein
MGSGPGRIRTCDLGIKSPLLYRLSYRPLEASIEMRVMDSAGVSLLRWLRRQLREPLAAREHLEAAVANDDPREARRLLESVPFTEEQRRHVRSLLEAWERRKV